MFSKYILFSLLLIIILSGFDQIHQNFRDHKNPDIAIMAYYVAPRDNYQPEELPLHQLTHIIFSFTEVIDNEMKFKHASSGEKLRQLVEQKKNYPELQVMIACGGWGGSGGFSDMAKDPETRSKFVESTIRFVEEYGLDGVDIDWEYPGLRGAGNPYLPEDKENFTALMRELREALDATGKDLTLTFASAGWQRYYDHIEVQKVMKYADYMNVMTYDLVSGSSPYTAHHTNLGRVEHEDIENTPIKKWMEERGSVRELRSTEKIIAYCIDQGVNPRQLVIGAAFYGRAWKGVPPADNGLYQSNTGVFIGWAPYSDIRKKYEGKNGFTRYWDPNAKAPYLYNQQDRIFISYDDTLSVKLKTRFVRNQNLGGIMFWQLGNDTREDENLLDAIYSEAAN